jgi:hypothetical protein
MTSNCESDTSGVHAGVPPQGEDDLAFGVLWTIALGVLIAIASILFLSVGLGARHAVVGNVLAMAAPFCGVMIWAPAGVACVVLRRKGYRRTARGVVIGACVLLMLNIVGLIALGVLAPSWED